MRDDKWLFSKLDEIWDAHFPDVPQDNDVRIIWGKRARCRLGSIKQIPNNKYQITNKTQNQKYQNQKIIRKSQISNLKSKCHPETIITINSLFKDFEIPEYVVVGTIAHELAHYAHGFHSPLEKKYDTPHAGGVVSCEMRRRGLEKIQKAQKKWLKENWKDYVENHLPRKTRTRRRQRIIRVKWV